MRLVVTTQMENFGHAGEMNFFRAFRFDKNGIQKNKT